MTIIDNATWTAYDRLRKARMLADLDQTQMAAALGVARNTVSNWERGINEPPASAFVRWADVTGVSIEWLAASYRNDAETTTAPAEARAVEGGVRPKGLEPLTF
ncbi:helix-turn-helix domain-containing protein [Microbacterium sp. NPDC077663]|uniref:helix-turn-helix domain-containing protein n=1 Tax=Microbacterium sp. NPDC077663 TaxID=3364189 RepID=UPI0037C70364